MEKTERDEDGEKYFICNNLIEEFLNALRF